MDRSGEEAFFVVLNNNDIWIHLKRWIRYYFDDKRTANITDYVSGDSAVYYNYRNLLTHNKSLVFTDFSKEYVIGQHNIELIKFLHFNKKVVFDTIDITTAILALDFEIVKFFMDFIEHDSTTTIAEIFAIKYKKHMMDFLCRSGHLQSVKYFHFLINDTDIDFTENAMTYAGRNGHLDIVKFIYFNSVSLVNIKYIICHMIVEHVAHMDIYKFLLSQRNKPSQIKKGLAIEEGVIIKNTISSNNFELFKMCFEELKFKKTIDIFTGVVNWNRDTFMEYLYKDIPREFIPNIFRYAIIMGRQEIVKYFLQQGPNYCDKPTFLKIIGVGNIEMVQIIYPSMNLTLLEIEDCCNVALHFQHLEIYDFICNTSNLESKLLPEIGEKINKQKDMAILVYHENKWNSYNWDSSDDDY